TLQAPDVAEELARGQLLVDAEILREVTELPTQRLRLAHAVASLPEEGARGRARDGCEDAHQRRPACSVGAADSHNALSRLEREGPARLGPGVALAEGSNLKPRVFAPAQRYADARRRFPEGRLRDFFDPSIRYKSTSPGPIEHSSGGLRINGSWLAF